MTDPILEFTALSRLVTLDKEKIMTNWEVKEREMESIMGYTLEEVDRKITYVERKMANNKKWLYRLVQQYNRPLDVGYDEDEDERRQSFREEIKVAVQARDRLETRLDEEKQDRDMLQARIATHIMKPREEELSRLLDGVLISFEKCLKEMSSQGKPT